MTTTPTPTPTSGAAIQRYKIGYRSYEWGQRSSTPSGIPDASGSWVRYADHVTALAAGQATAAQAEPDPTPGDHPQPCDSELFESGVSVGLFDIPQWTAEALCKGIAAATGARVDWHYIGGRVHVKALPAPTSAEGVAYAALPDEGEPWRGHKFKEVQRGCWRCDCGKTIKEVTSDQSTPASGGNYPVMPKRYTVDDDGEELFTAEKMRSFADATYMLRASHGQAPAGAGEAAEHYRNAIARACEGWTMPDGLRKHLETALWSPPTPQPTQPQAGAVPLTDEYPALVCDYCGALTPDPWHSSGMLHGKMSKHIHSCDACAARGVAKAQDTREPRTPERVKEIVQGAGYDQCGIPDTERAAFINGLRHGEREHGVRGDQHG